MLMSLLFFSLLSAQTAVATNLENYSYQYIVKLYDRGDTEILESEIQSFLAKYPQSTYRHYLRFIAANLLLEDQNYVEALSIYDEILVEDIELTVRHQVYLHRALSLIGLKEYDQAMTQLQLLQSESRDSFLLAQAELYRGRIYKTLGLYYSAMQAYQSTLQHNTDPEIEYEYFEVLVQLQKDQEAKALLTNISPQSHIYAKSNVLWAQYLLENNRFEEYEDLLTNIPDLLTHPHIELLSLRKAIALRDYSAVFAILESTPNRGDQFQYFEALALVHAGDFAEADFIFGRLVKNADPELKVLSYLERLKLLFMTDPTAAKQQLAEFINNAQNHIARAEQLYTMGYFCFVQEEFPEALKYLSQARAETENRLQMADIDILIARSWLLAEEHTRAIQSMNRYLNLYPQGKDRDTALYYLGYLYHEAKDYKKAAPAFDQLISAHPQSMHVPSAKFYLAEMDYYLANYNLALTAYLEILQAEPENFYAALRVAQVYFYLGSYGDAELWLAKLDPSYDSLILQGHINFNRKDYAAALKNFRQAESATEKELRITEAKSYSALCLYQMKRYSEATAIYLQLYQGKESPDTYLYLGAKSAYAAGDYHLALELFEQFVDTFPDSQYYLPVLADIANSYYNMGNYRQALRDYQNILLRFRNIQDFDASDQALLHEVFTGIELTLRRLDDALLAYEVAEMADTFQSHFIRFELSYLVLKIYAEGEQWQEVLSSAEQMRMEFPQQSRMEVELLMSESLIKLNEYDSADSLLSTLYQDTQDPRALIQWAEVDMHLGDYESAMDKYQSALTLDPTPTLWYQALQASVQAGYLYFEQIWEQGEDFADKVSQARLLRLAQLSFDAHFEQAELLADLIINESLNAHDHATAFYYKALILFMNEDYEAAIAEFKKTMVLFPDFADIQDLCAYHVILSYLNLEARAEAEMHLWDYGQLLSDIHLEVLNGILEESR
jgi:tetratricopeptide (TPR) repeat protein